MLLWQSDLSKQRFLVMAATPVQASATLPGQVKSRQSLLVSVLFLGTSLSCLGCFLPSLTYPQFSNQFSNTPFLI